MAAYSCSVWRYPCDVGKLVCANIDIEAPTSETCQVSEYMLANGVSPKHELAATAADCTVQIKAIKGANILVDVELNQHFGECHGSYAPPLI
jgi:hypothetical protein